VQFLKMARGSLLELETHLVLAKELGYVAAAPFKALESETTTIAKMLHRLIGRLTTG
jgi:four helix bundle protein